MVLYIEFNLIQRFKAKHVIYLFITIDENLIKIKNENIVVYLKKKKESV